MQTAHQPPFITTALIYVVVIALFVWRMARPQRMSIARLWAMPFVLLLLTGFSVWANGYAGAMVGAAPPPAWEVAAVLLVGAVLGVPLGLLRGQHTDVKATERPGVMYVRSSPIIVIVWLAAFVAKAVLRAYLPHGQSGAALGGDGLMAFAVAALITSYYAIYTKYRALNSISSSPGTAVS